MRQRVLSLCLMVAAALPSTLAFAAGSDGAIELKLPALDREKIAQEDAANSFKAIPPRFAIARDVSYVPGKQGAWIEGGDGKSTWRVNVKTPDAVHLNFGFSNFYLPPTATMVISSGTTKNQLGPFTETDNQKTGQLWTEILQGNDASIELSVATVYRDRVDVRLSRVAQGYRGFGSPDKFCKSGACNMDLACLAAGDPWNEPRRSVAAITVGGTDTCTGSLVNNTNGDRRLLFATAAHCSINAGNVASMRAYFNYEFPTCRTPGSSASGAAAGPKPASSLAGLTWLASTNNPFSGSTPANTRSDWTLVELATTANIDTFNLYWAGWDRGAPPTTCAAPGTSSSTTGLCASIHHPGVDEKRITFVEVPMTLDNIASATGVHWQANWDPTPPILANVPAPQPASLPPQVTEPGSSGSPLYNANQRLIGVLSGGPSACGVTGASLRDQYGGLFHSWEGVGTATTRMRDYLDPTNSGVNTFPGRGNCTPPLPPTIGTATATGANQIQVSWANSVGAESYDVLRAEGTCASPGAFSIVGDDVAASPFVDSMVSGGTTYAYRVRAFDTGESCESLNSGCVQATATGTCTLSPTFAGLTSATSSNQSSCSVDLGWTAATPRCAGPASYSVYRSTTSGFTPGAGNLIGANVTATTFNDPSVIYNTPYYYIVRANDTSNGTQDTNTVERAVVPRGPVSSGNITETFEMTPGFDNPGWSQAALSGATVWTWSTAQSQTPTHSWASSSQTTISNRVLVSPEFGALANTTLSFWHTYAFESSTSCFDAGTLETSANGGTTWIVVPDAAFTSGGFTGTVSSSWSNPIAGKRAWCNGTIGAMTQVNVNLSAFSGQTLRVRWHAGDDSSAAVTGWFVDSVSIANAGTAGVCAAVNPDSLFQNGFE